VNGLQNGGLGLTKDEILAALSEMGLSEMVRGETLSLEQFALLSDILQKNHNI
jgi:16S rRNA (adenine1518-N6/adenine1519-N6)-dimethyltransferase